LFFGGDVSRNFASLIQAALTRGCRVEKDETKKVKRITFRVRTGLIGLAVVALVGAGAAVVNTTSVPSHPAEVAAALSERAATVGQTVNRSHNRFECGDTGCNRFAPQAPKPVVAKKPPVKKPVIKKKTSTSHVGAGCTRLVATVWHGPCPKVSKDYAVATAKQQLAARGWASQFSCLSNIVRKESGWNVYAVNPSSHSYGIPQALPGYKLAGGGPNWGYDAKAQIKWMLSYIASRYKTPCGAWSYWQVHNWY
jgi:hypothetical protein